MFASKGVQWHGVSNTGARMRVVESLTPKPVKAGVRELLNTTKQNAPLTAYRRVTFTAIIAEQISIIQALRLRPGVPRLAVATA
ncbi:MAG: hypothetical protein ABI284_08855 [Nitrosospira sp.]